MYDKTVCRKGNGGLLSGAYPLFFMMLTCLLKIQFGIAHSLIGTESSQKSRLSLQFPEEFISIL